MCCVLFTPILRESHLKTNKSKGGRIVFGGLLLLSGIVLISRGNAVGWVPIVAGSIAVIVWSVRALQSGHSTQN